MTNLETPATQAWMTGFIDYAGLFPPAALDMPAAAAAYAAELSGSDAWMLGRFIVSATVLSVLAQARRALSAPAQPWRISAVLGADVDGSLAQVRAFNEQSGQRMVIDTVEAKADSVEAIDRLGTAAAGLFVYVEIPLGESTPALLDRVALRGLRAKVRTGGIVAEAFPEPGLLAGFLSTAVQMGVPFKATAGLHHPLRGEYRLTYAEDAARGTMYGYLNLLLATAALHARMPGVEVERLLVARDPATLHVGEDGVRWRDLRFPSDVLAQTRTWHFVSVGSCSFREPVDELRALAVAADTR